MSTPALSHQLLRASAGTGKTYQLSNHFLSLLHRGVPASTILATTFTRKAAAEILDRIVGRLAEAAVNDAERSELARSIHATDLSRTGCLNLLAALARSLNAVRVSTLDSFFAQLARSFAFELGLPAAWEIADELEEARLKHEALDALLHENELQDLVRLMHLLTKGETTRGVSELLQSTVKDLYDLFQQTEKDAWHQIPRPKPLDKEELALALDELAAAALPADKRFAKARDSDYQKAVNGDWEGFIKGGLAAKVAAGDGLYYGKPIDGQLQDIYNRLLAHARAVFLGKAANQTEGTWELLQKFDARYSELKARHRRLRFDDVTRCLGALEELGGTGRLAFRLDGHIDHLLLDEFQDTSPMQWRAVLPFGRRVVDGKGRTFFCVGDVKQAIYGWRGGVAEIFDTVAEELGLSHSEALTTSYRSAPEIIQTVNTIFAGLTKHPNLDRHETAVRKWQESFPEHGTAKKNLRGFATLETAPDENDIDSQSAVTFDYAAHRAQEILQDAPGFRMGILVRRNDAVAQMIYRLRKLGIHASEEGGNPLTDSAAVRVVLSLLTLADHPGDRVAHFHVSHSPLASAVGLSTRNAASVANRVRRGLLEDGYGHKLDEWARILAPSCNRRELSRLQQLVELAYAYEPSATLRTRDFVSLVNSQRVADPTAADVRVMTVHQAKGLQFDIVVLPELDLDLNGQPPSFAAGRPHPAAPVDCVCRYVSADVQALLPQRFQRLFQETNDRSVTEILCVLYVAITRAVHALHMIIPPSKSNERTFPRRVSGLLRAALHGTAPVPPETTVWSHGNPQWFKDPGSDRRQAAFPESPCAEASPLEVRLADATGPPQRDLERMAPSRVHAGSRVKVAELLAGGMNADALQYGTILHAWLEQIEWLDDGPPEEATLRRIAARHAGTTHDIDRLLADFQQILGRKRIARLLRRDAYQTPLELPLPPNVLSGLAAARLSPKLYREHPFAFQQDGKIYQGTIDRLVLLFSGDQPVAGDILDYKTEDTLPDTLERHRDQLGLYRQAVSHMVALPIEHIAARLVMLRSGTILELAP